MYDITGIAGIYRCTSTLEPVSTGTVVDVEAGLGVHRHIHVAHKTLVPADDIVLFFVCLFWFWLHRFWGFYFVLGDNAVPQQPSYKTAACYPLVITSTNSTSASNWQLLLKLW